MLILHLDAVEMFDEVTQTFISLPPVDLRLEHSLVSISKWEMKWKRSFLNHGPKTREETIHYVKCMTMNQNVDPLVYSAIGSREIKAIDEYINDPHTATTFAKTSSIGDRRIVTSELIYYWMSMYNIPMECQKWHLGRLMTLLRVASEESSPKKKMSQRAVMERNRALNKARREALKTKG